MSPAALRPQTQNNLHVAILAIARIHNLGEVPDSVLGHLMDQMRDALTPEQRLDPLSVYSPQVLGLVTARIEEAYGLDRPANIHAAPQDPSKLDARAEDAGSFFAQDAFGLTRQQRQFGGISNEEHSLRTLLPVGAYRTSYADIDPRVWNPSSGAAGLTSLNFGTTDFARSGLDLPTTQYLFGQGFTSNQIIHAGQDASALGLNPKDRQTTRDFALLDRVDPAGRAQRQDADKAYGEWIARNRDQITAMQAAIDEAPDDATRQRRRDALTQFMQQGHSDTGQAAVDARLADIPLAPGVEPGGADDPVAAQQRNRRRIEQVNGGNLDLVGELGRESILETDLNELTQAQAPPAPNSVSVVKRAILTGLDQDPLPEASDANDFGVAPQTAQVAAARVNTAPTATDDMDNFGVAPEPETPSVPGAPTAPAVQLAAVEPAAHPGKDEDDKVAAEPERPATQLAAASVKPPTPTA